jgi:uncharacterized protein (DUF433 family)
MTDEEMIAKHIRCIPGHPGDARVMETGVPVWVIVDFDLSVDGDARRIAESYGLSKESIDAARAYYRLYHEYIDATRLLKTAPFAPSR